MSKLDAIRALREAAAQAPREIRRKPAVVPAPSADPQDIALTLRHLRYARGESLQQAATAIGCTKPHLWELERGKSANPSLSLLRSLARHYGVTVAHIIGEAP